MKLRTQKETPEVVAGRTIREFRHGDRGQDPDLQATMVKLGRRGDTKPTIIAALKEDFDRGGGKSRTSANVILGIITTTRDRKQAVELTEKMMEVLDEERPDPSKKNAALHVLEQVFSRRRKIFNEASGEVMRDRLVEELK